MTDRDAILRAAKAAAYADEIGVIDDREEAIDRLIVEATAAAEQRLRERIEALEGALRHIAITAEPPPGDRSPVRLIIHGLANAALKGIEPPVVGNCPECDEPLGDGLPGCAHWPAPSPASPRQGEEDRPARCVEEGCVRTPGHVGAHTSRPYWPRELRDELALEPFTKVVVGIYDPATQQTETIVGDPASPRQGEPVEELREALSWALRELAPYSHAPECSPMACVCGYDKAHFALAASGDEDHVAVDLAAALSEPAEAGT